MKSATEHGAAVGADLRWDVRLTRDLVCKSFGTAQWAKAHPSVRSMADRPEFCRYHYHEAADMLDSYIAANLEKAGLWKVFDDRDEFGYLMLKLRANVVAFVQSLHAVADTCAHAVYYALALDRSSRALRERDISAAGVLKRLQQQCGDGHSEFSEVYSLFVQLVSEGDYAYLNALANTSKHRAIVRPALNEDATGARQERWILFLEPFSYRGIAYQKVDVRQFMRNEHSRIQALTVHIGASLNQLLMAGLMAGPATLQGPSSGPEAVSADA